MKGQDWDQDYHGLLLQPSVPQPTNGTFLWSRPANPEWEPIWSAVWLGSGEATMTAIGLLLVLLGYKSRAIAQVLGFNSQQTQQAQQDASVKLALLGCLFAYPIAAFALAMVNGTTELIMPDPSKWSELMVAMYADWEALGGSLQGEGKKLAEAIRVGLLSIILAISTFAWLILLKAREILVEFYFLVLPLVIPLRYSGVPVVSDYAKKFLQQYVAVLLIPVVPAAMARLYITVYPNYGFGGLVVPALFIIITLYLTWKLFTSAAPVATTAISGGVRGTLAGGVLATGGSGYAAARMLRGRYVSGAIYATNPDFDFRPAEEDTER